MLKRLLSKLALASLVLAPFSFAVIDIAEIEKNLPSLSRTPLMEQEARLVVEMLETMHFESAEISNENFRKLINEYMKSLDYNKLYFLASDEQQFANTHGDELGFKLRYEGDLAAAFEIYERYRSHAVSRIRWALETLKQDWTFDSDEAYVFDRSESEWPATQEEADALWQLRLKYEILQEVLNDKTQEEAKERIAKRYERLLRSLTEVGSKNVQEIFLSSLTQMFDPHSSFLSSDTLEDFKIQMRLSLVGIGAILSEEDGYCVIKELVPGAPAIRTAKLKPNDRIVAVQQSGQEPVDIVGMGLRKIVEQIRGEKGTTVTLTIIPSDAIDESIRQTVQIVRDVVHINSNRTTGQIYQVPNAEGAIIPIGVIDIPSFYGGDEYVEDGKRYVTSVTADVEELVIKMKQAGVKGIVLDLRRNGGGLLDEAISMTGLFIRRGPVVQVREKNGYIVPHMDRDQKVAYDGPLAVLTSRYSASASEIVAGALQNYGRSITIGNSSTHGKGTVQQVYGLNDYVLRKDLANDKAGAAKLTVRKFYLPNGFSTQRKGVVPDILVESIDEITAKGEADLPQALSWDYIKPVTRFVEMALKNSFVERLQSESSARKQSLEEFTFLTKRLDWFKERQDRKEISLNLEQRKAMMEADEAFLETMKAEQRRLASFNFTKTDVKLDSVIRDEAKRAAEDALHGTAPPEDEPTSGASLEALAAVELSGENGSNEKKEDEEPVPDFDIQLREALRIVNDAIRLDPNPADWTQPALPIAQKSRFEKLVN